MRKTNYTSPSGIEYFRKYAKVNGRRKMVYAESKKDWEKKVDQLKLDEAMGIISTDKTVEQAMDIWVYVVLATNPSIRLSTFSIYEGVYRTRLKGSPILGKKLKEVKSLDVQNFINSELDNGRSVHSVQGSVKVLNMFFKYAVSEGYMIRNPRQNAHIPSTPPPTQIKVFTDDEISRIKNALVGDRDRFLFLLCLSTGMRQGEALALKHSDFGKTIHITKSQQNERHIKKGQKTTYEIIDGKPKTDASYRDIPVPASIVLEYEKHKQICQLEKLARGKGKLKDDDYMFLSIEGLRWHTGQVQKKWKKTLDKAGVEYKSFHSLRHTYITKLVQSGINIPTVMQLAGHSKIATTLRYTHVEMEHKVEAIDVIEKMINV